MTKFPTDEELEIVRKELDQGLASRPLPKDASPVDRTKYRLCEKFVIYKNEHKISQKELASKIGIDEALMSKILRYQFDEFTTDRLIKYLNVIYPQIDVKVEVA
tara:strand:+ start:1566 stop:1877 length:312 start_codon:yes stop_codon:yes gene_type:complete